jgi:transposase
MEHFMMSTDGPFKLHSQQVGALPIVCRFLDRIGLGGVLERHLGPAEGRCSLSAARAIGVLVRNLCVSREPLYGLGEWACGYDPWLLDLAADEVALLNDDRIGRALDRLFEADRASLLCELVLGVIKEFAIDCSQLHNDSTSISVHGSYPAADGRERSGKRTIAITYGHSKDHRPDLKQLVVILTVSADGAVPLAQRVCDGNTADAGTHIETWERLRSLVGRSDFLYVADCKLVTSEQMDHINAHGGRFVSVLPRTRKETAWLCEWMTTNTPDWTEAARRPSTRRGEPDEIWSTVPAPIKSAEGYRIVWIHSTHKAQLDHAARHDQLARALAALDSLNTRLAGPKCRITDRAAVDHAATSALRAQSVTKLIDYQITEQLETRIRIESNGHGKKPRQRKLTRTRLTLTWTVNETALQAEAAAYGCFPLITNDHALTDAQLLAAYRYQPNLEKRHHQLKTVLESAPIQLKSPARIEALLTCQFIALLTSALIERELRNAMRRQQITQLPLYPEQRACQHPTAARTIELFNDLTRHHLHHNHQHIQTFTPELTPLQAQLLKLLNIPTTAYTNKPTTHTAGQ